MQISKIFFADAVRTSSSTVVRTHYTPYEAQHEAQEKLQTFP